MDATKNITLHYNSEKPHCSIFDGCSKKHHTPLHWKAKMSHCTNLDFDKNSQFFIAPQFQGYLKVYISTRFSETMFWHSLVLWTTKHQLQLNDIDANLDGTYWVYLLMISTPSTISYHSSTFKEIGINIAKLVKSTLAISSKQRTLIVELQSYHKRLRGYLI